MYFVKTKLNLDTMDLVTIMIDVERDMLALEGDMIIVMMDLINLVIIQGKNMLTYMAMAAVMTIVEEAKINTRYTMDRHCGE